MRMLRRSTLTLLALLTVGPVFAYTIYLTDGSSLQSKEKYKVNGNRAVITLPNGNQTFIPLKQIDVARTDQANANDYGSAVVIDSHQIPPAAAPPPPQQTLTNLIHDKTPAPRVLPPAVRVRPGSTAASASSPPGTLLKTKAGYSDLSTLTRRPCAQADVAAELQQFFHGQGMEEVEIFQGTQSDRPLVEVTTSSEASVFRALAVSATALLHVRDSHPKVSGFELLLMTSTKERAGQFIMTPQMASEIAARNVEVSAFFLSNVQF
jgi:hypothetical protein